MFGLRDPQSLKNQFAGPFSARPTTLPVSLLHFVRYHVAVGVQCRPDIGVPRHLRANRYWRSDRITPTSASVAERMSS